jgi:hypothetical protein
MGRCVRWRRDEILRWIDADCPSREDWEARERRGPQAPDPIVGDEPGAANSFADDVAPACQASSLAESMSPKWIKDASGGGELWLGERRLKRVVPRGTNVIKVLDAFHEEGWPERIDDPLDPSRGSQRLHDTIRSLNEGLQGLRFHADGTGEAITYSIRPA